MNKLPLELHDRIVQFVGRRIGEDILPPWQHGRLPLALPAIATVSRTFQQAVERHTFRDLHVSTSPSDLDDFRRVLTPQRQRNLQRLTIHLWIDLALLGKTTFATDEERRTIDETTTTRLRELFNILAAWHLPTPSLTLEVTGPPLFGSVPGPYLRFSMLDVLDDVADFPPLPMVKHLYMYSSSYHLHPHLVVSLTAKMSNVSQVNWDLSTYQTTRWGSYHYMSRVWRDGLVQSIESTTLPPLVEKFTFQMVVPGTNKSQILPDFIGSTSWDPVSSALRKLTKNCSKVCINGSVHTSLFDPLAVEGEAALAWEKVTQLEVKANMCGPDGKWLFKIDPNDGAPEDLPEDLPEDPDFNRLPPGYGTTELELDGAEGYYNQYQDDNAPDAMGEYGDIFRADVDDGPMNALLAAFARGFGGGRLPALCTATLQSEFFNTENWPFQVNCFAAGTAAPLGWDAEFADGDRYAWRVFFHVNDWRPTEETLGEFRRIGRERDGRDTVVCFLPWGNFLD